MTDIYGYAAAAPLYRAAGWMQVIPLPEGRKTPPPSGFTGRSRKPVTDEQVQVWSQATPDANTGIVIPEGVLVLDIDAAQGHQVKADGVKASASSRRNWACFRPRGAARRTASTRRHATCSTRCPRDWRGRAAPSRGSTSCSPATGIPWSGRRSPERRNELPVHAKRRILRHAPPYRRLGDTAMEVGGLPAQTRQRSNSTTLTPSYSREYDDRMCKAVNTFLNKTLANPASKGSRHDTTLQAVWALVNFAQEGHRGALDAINQLKPRFIAEVAPDCQGKEREADANGPAFSVARWRRSTACNRMWIRASSRKSNA